MAGSSGASLDNAGGTISPSSSATAQGGKVSSGDRVFGGINVGSPQNASIFTPTNIAIAAGLFFAFRYAKSKKWV